MIIDWRDHGYFTGRDAYGALQLISQAPTIAPNTFIANIVRESEIKKAVKASGGNDTQAKVIKR